MAFLGLFHAVLLGLAGVALSALVPPGQTGVDPQPQPDLRKWIVVDPATSVIEEKSVSLLSGLQANQNLGLTQRDGTAKAYNDVVIKRNIQPRERADLLPDMQAELPNGATYYVFQLRAKENLKVSLSCDVPGMVWLQFMKPALDDAMAGAFRRANMAPKNLRSKKIEITNVFDKVYEVVLVAYGTVNYPYTLKIARKS